MFKQAPKPASTQAHLPIAGIEDGVIILRDGTYRAVLTVSSTNFLLKSDQEQNALIYAYQNFLNSLNFHIQIVMQSRRLDLEPYLKKLEGTILNQHNELIRQQTTDYIAYVRELITVANIMDKHFYLIVPYTPPLTTKRGLLPQIFPQAVPPHLTIDEAQFSAHRTELLQRAEIIANGLSGLSIKADLLGTDDLIKVLYQVYNYDIASEERLEKPQELAGAVISAQPQTEQAAIVDTNKV